MEGKAKPIKHPVQDKIWMFHIMEVKYSVPGSNQFSQRAYSFYDVAIKGDTESDADANYHFWKEAKEFNGVSIREFVWSPDHSDPGKWEQIGRRPGVVYNPTQAGIDAQNRVLQEWRQREECKNKCRINHQGKDYGLKPGDRLFITEYGIVIKRKEQNG
jgi:hypothetical protein